MQKQCKYSPNTANHSLTNPPEPTFTRQVHEVSRVGFNQLSVHSLGEARTCFFFRARFQILHDMFSSRVLRSCGLLIAAVCIPKKTSRKQSTVRNTLEHHSVKTTSSRRRRTIRDSERPGGGKKKSSNGGEAYADPGLVQVSLVEAGDNLLDEVACGAEPAALPQHERGLVPLLPGRARRGGGRGDFFRRAARVEDGLQVAVDPVIPRHLLRPPRTTPLSLSRR